MNRVKMLKTQLGTHDGYTPVRFLQGKTYDIADDLLRAFIDAGCAELVFENKAVHDMPNRPFLEGVEHRGGINKSPADSLSRPAPPQPYKTRKARK